MALSSKVLLVSIAILAAIHPVVALKPNVTRIQFYMHDIVSGPNATAIQVAGRRTNYTGSDPISAMFGSVFMMDNPLTATPELNSTLLGRAQGIYAMASQQNEFSLLMTLTFGLTSGPYNGSSFSVVGRNPIMSEVREMPVVGGTGIFRMARGYCLARTFSFRDMDAVIDSLVDDMRRNQSTEKNKWKVDDFVSFKRTNYMAQESSAPSESEASGDGKSRCSSKSSIDDGLPELVVFLHDANYEFVKDISLDKAVTFHEECFEENCYRKNGYIPCFLRCNIVDSDSESTEESEDLESSISSTESAQILENELNKVTEQQKACSDVTDELPTDLSKKKAVPKILLDREVAGKKTAATTNSIAMSLSKVLNENNYRDKAAARSNIERGSIFCNSKLSVSTIGGGWRADCRHCHECESTSTGENNALEKQAGEYRGHGFVHQHNQKEISLFALDPASSCVAKSSLTSYSGSVSLRSNSSTNSSHSFAFPVLQTEWNGSPERMIDANQMQPRRHRLWRMCFPCCKF